MEKRMISKKGCRIMMAAAAVLAVIAAFITYQVGAVYGTEPLPLDLAVQKAFFFSEKSDTESYHNFNYTFIGYGDHNSFLRHTSGTAKP